MEILFQGSNTFVSPEAVEHDGRNYDPKHLIDVYAKKDSGYRKGIIWGTIFVFVSISCFTSYWTTFGLILLLLGGGLIGWNYYQIQDERATTFVCVSFSGGRHTGEPDAFVAIVNSYIEAMELQSALWKAKELAGEES